MPQETKDQLLMVNNESFFGYNKLGAEITKGATDHREQFDFGTPGRGKHNLGSFEYYRLWGESQWPSETDLPGFYARYSEYLSQVESLSFEFISLLAEALGLPPNSFDRFFDAPKESMVHRSKASLETRTLEEQVVKYPVMPQGSSDQGVGPHFDGGFLTFLLQASPHPGLQAQNARGDWVSAPPRPRTLVVNTGKALETATRGLARATSHRVLAPKETETEANGASKVNGTSGSAKGFSWVTDGVSDHPTGARYSIPFFQSISQDIRVAENVLDFPQDVMDLLKDRDGNITSESVRSHPDVGERHYPGIFKEIFPNGVPARA
ncbi:hypothetical protein FRC10_011262 [Ceratobasidium sp. 414]|nr:hypothetical protein FRC10_011262 [Ceratobasidium sp. 414]